MRKAICCVFLVIFWGLMLSVSNAAARTNNPPSAVDPDLPYGGAYVTPGSLGPGPAPGEPDLSGACPNYDPCVLTGQYNQHRTSTNAKASKLAGLSDFSNFGAAYLYPVTNKPAGRYWEPVIAQPLYVTNVSVPSALSGSNACNGNLASCKMLLVGTLSDYLYAFDTSSPPGGPPNYNWLWNPINLAQALNPDGTQSHCGTGGGPFMNAFGGLPGVRNLPYYGIVATPVIDTAPGRPTAFVVSACVISPNSSAISWYLDAIDLTTGKIRADSVNIADPGNFIPWNQIARPSLLLTHPPQTNTTYVYVTFGDGIREIGAENTQGNSANRYTGAIFGFSYNYMTDTFSPPLAPIFYTSCMQDPSQCPSGPNTVFPSVWDSLAPNYAQGGPAGPPSSPCTLPVGGGAGNCSLGSNWAVNNGGCWMSSRGPASTQTADVLVACSNGPFACGYAANGQTQTSCTNPSSLFYRAQSVVELPAANASVGVAAAVYTGGLSVIGNPQPGTQCGLTFIDGGTPNGQALISLPLTNAEPLTITAPGIGYTAAPTAASVTAGPCTGTASLDTVIGNQIPQDFYAPYKELYTINLPSNDLHPATYQTQELSRVDQDFGTGGAVVIPQAGGNFVMTADKSGYGYLMPPPFGETTSSTLGQFQPNDQGLTNGLAFTTEPPFQLSRHPQFNESGYCPALDQNNTGELIRSGACDEVHELTWNNDLLFVLPSNESLEVFQGHYTPATRTTPANYTFGTVPAYDPCPAGCTGSNPPFPPSDPNSAGGAMAVAAWGTAASLWTIVPQVINSASNVGTLYAYAASSANLSHLWDTLNPPAACKSPAASGWVPTAFTEPTLAENQQTATAYGAVYVPTVCAITNPLYTDCATAAQNHAVASGVLVFTSCPAGH